MSERTDEGVVRKLLKGDAIDRLTLLWLVVATTFVAFAAVALAGLWIWALVA